MLARGESGSTSKAGSEGMLDGVSALKAHYELLMGYDITANKLPRSGAMEAGLLAKAALNCRRWRLLSLDKTA